MATSSCWAAFLAFWLFTLYAHQSRAAVPIAFAVFRWSACRCITCWCRGCLRAKDPEMLSFILFFGLSQVIEAVTTIAFGTSERSIPGDQPGAVIAAVMGFFAGHRGRERPGRAFSARLPGIVGGKRHRQRLRRAARVCLSLSHAARLPDTRGDGQPRGSGRDRHRRAPCLGHRLWRRARPRRARRRVRAFHARQHHAGHGRRGNHHRLSPSSSSARSAIRSAPCSAALFTASRTC